MIMKLRLFRLFNKLIFIFFTDRKMKKELLIEKLQDELKKDIFEDDLKAIKYSVLLFLIFQKVLLYFSF